MDLLKAIIVEDSEDDLFLLLRALKKGGYETVYTRVETAETLREALKDGQWQIVISDHAMPQFSAPEALEVLKESRRDLPFIIVSGTIGEEVAVAAMREGAHDYIMKDKLARLAPAVTRELRDAEMRRQQKVYEEQLEYLTLHDSLTGLYNRVYFENELERLEGSRSYPITVVSADLDGLKLINDTFGQKEGDRVLIKCAELLSRPLRRGDILARVGGDEFVALLPQTGLTEAQELISGISSSVETYNAGNGQSLPLSISIGFAVAENTEQLLENTVKEATRMMLIDKQNRSESARNQVVSALLAALAERDYISGGHAERLDAHCEAVGREIGLEKDRLTNLSLLAKVHDLGKVGIPDQILFKKSGLTEEEWQIMKKHPEIGSRIAQASPELVPIANLILKHHEKWDGSGYPLGLSGDDIPLECRILAIIDAYDAITNDRPYSKAKSKEEALEEINRNAGTQFDPDLARLFTKLVKQNDKPS